MRNCSYQNTLNFDEISPHGEISEKMAKFRENLAKDGEISEKKTKSRHLPRILADNGAISQKMAKYRENLVSFGFFSLGAKEVIVRTGGARESYFYFCFFTQLGS